MFTLQPRETALPLAALDGKLLFSMACDGARVFVAPGFDAWRFAYAGAVVLGLAPRSMLSSRDLERMVDAMERCALGPFARRV